MHAMAYTGTVRRFAGVAVYPVNVKTGVFRERRVYRIVHGPTKVTNDAGEKQGKLDDT